MMGRRNQGQGQLFYEFRLDEAVPDDHLVRKIKALFDLSRVYSEQAPYYSEIGRPSIPQPTLGHSSPSRCAAHTAAACRRSPRPNGPAIDFEH